MFYRDTWAEINLDAFSANYEMMKKHTNKEIIVVLKANGYSHGDYYMAKQAMECGCKYIAVSSLDEAISLRNKGISCQILILGYVKPEDIHVAIENDVTLSVVSLEWVQSIKDMNLDGLKVHLKIDTGMNRLGMKKIEDIEKVLQILLEKNVDVEGIYTHYHSADDEDKTKCSRQKNWFYHVLDTLPYSFKWVHTSNSDASISFSDERSNAVRLGLALYGIKNIESSLNLLPVFSLYTTLTCVKEVNQNETIGYGATYKCNKKEIIATIPIGYGDGFIRANQGRYVCIDGHPYEIVGRICMDQCMVKLDDFYPVGEKVEIIGKHISIEDMARQLQMIPYEVLCLLNDRIPKVYYKNNKEIAAISTRFQ